MHGIIIAGADAIVGAVGGTTVVTSVGGLTFSTPLDLSAGRHFVVGEGAA
jgi:hypothetical protein